MTAKSYSKRLVQWGASATALGSIFTLIFTLFPSVRIPPRTPPPKLHAAMTHLALEHGMTFGDYRKRTPWLADGPSPADPRELGSVIYFEVTLVGFTNQQCRVTGSVYDAQSQSRVFNLNEISHFTPEAEHDTASSQLWFPFPKKPGSFFVRLALYDHKGVRLTSADSEVFITAVPPANASAHHLRTLPPLQTSYER